MSTDAIAYAAGALLLRGRKAPEGGLVNEARTAVHDRAQKYEKNVSGHITIGHRWLILHVLSAEPKALWGEVQNQWFSQPRISFAHLVTFLCGYFDTTSSAVLNREALSVLAAEIERVGDGLPPRFQHLFFEVMSVLDEYGDDLVVDLQVVKDALELQKIDFPNLAVTAIAGGKKAAGGDGRRAATTAGSGDEGLGGEDGLDNGQKVGAEGIAV
jgi:hypothetical protein